MLQFKNSHRPRLAALLRMLYHLLAQYGCSISTCHLQGVSNSVADALSRGWLHRFFELCPYASSEPTQIRLHDFDFSGLPVRETRCPCEDVGAWLMVTIYFEGPRPQFLATPVNDAPVGFGPVTSSQGDSIGLTGGDQSTCGQVPVSCSLGGITHDDGSTVPAVSTVVQAPVEFSQCWAALVRGAWFLSRLREVVLSKGGFSAQRHLSSSSLATHFSLDHSGAGCLYRSEMDQRAQARSGRGFAICLLAIT